MLKHYLLLYFSSHKIIDIGNLTLLSPEAQCKTRLNFVQRKNSKFMWSCLFSSVWNLILCLYISAGRVGAHTHTQRCLCVRALMHGRAEPPAHTAGLKCTEINWKVRTVKILSARGGPSFSSALSVFLHVSARAKSRVCGSLNFQFCWYFRAGTLQVSIFWITVRRTHRATSLNKFLCSSLWNPFLVPGFSSQGRRAEPGSGQ